MFAHQDVAGVVLATGLERGLSGSDPDALCQLDGIPLVAHAVRTLGDCGEVGAIAVLVSRDSAASVRHALDRHVAGHRAVVIDRHDTDLVARWCAPADVVVVSDCHRPLTPPALVGRVLDAVRRGADVSVPAVAVTETIKELDPGGWIVRTVARETLSQVQSPWALRAMVGAGLWADPLADVDTAALLRRFGDCRLVTVAGHPDAFGLRTPADLQLASAVLRARQAAEVDTGRCQPAGPPARPPAAPAEPGR